MILQCCPLNVIMLLSDMSCWTRYVHHRVPGAEIGAYFDDRTLWGSNADTISDALNASFDYDQAASWV